MSIEVIFETHSLSVDNERGVASGWLDSCLSEKGKHLAKLYRILSVLHLCGRKGGFMYCLRIMI